MENLWKTYGKSMENLWKIYEKSMENLWKIYEKAMENRKLWVENSIRGSGQLPIFHREDTGEMDTPNIASVFGVENLGFL